MGVTALTGSASGIGKALRERLERDGDRVIGVDLRGAEIEAVTGEWVPAAFFPLPTPNFS